MQRQRGELVPIGEAFSGLDAGPLQAIRDATPQARHHFTQADQVNLLVTASEADPETGFMARMMALCSLPRTNPGNRKEYKRVNGPYKLIMTAIDDNKLPYGSLPRLLLAWVSTEAVRTQSRELILGRSLSDFMRALGVEPVGGVRTRLRNQMRRLFNAHVRLVYKDERGEASVSSSVADRTAFWWNERKPDEPSLWDSTIELGEKFFNEIINHPVPLDLNTLTALKTLSVGPRSLPVGHLPDVLAEAFAAALVEAVVPPVRRTPGQSQPPPHRPKLPQRGAARVEEDQDRLAGLEVFDGSGRLDPLAINSRDRIAQSSPARPLISPFLGSQRPITAPAGRFGPSTPLWLPESP